MFKSIYYYIDKFDKDEIDKLDKLISIIYRNYSNKISEKEIKNFRMNLSMMVARTIKNSMNFLSAH